MAPKAKAQNSGSTYSLQPLVVLLLLATFVMIIRMINGNTSMFTRPGTRGLICLGFFMWAWVYYSLTKTSLKVGFGITKIIAALWTNRYQLGKIGQEGWHNGVWDRWAFIAAALVVIASGFKDIAEGVTTYKGATSAPQPPKAS